MRTGFPCNENRVFPVRKSTQGKPCSGPVLALSGIAVYGAKKLFIHVINLFQRLFFEDSKCKISVFETP
jgi:hypothetical protein